VLDNISSKVPQNSSHNLRSVNNYVWSFQFLDKELTVTVRTLAKRVRPLGTRPNVPPRRCSILSCKAANLFGQDIELTG